MTTQHKWLTVFAAIIGLGLFGCELRRIQDGEVVRKEYFEPYTTKSWRKVGGIWFPVSLKHPAQYFVTIKSYSEEKEKWLTATWNVSETVYASAKEGEWFSVNQEKELET